MDTAIQQPLKVFLVEDYAPIRQRIAGLIEAMDGVRLVGEAGTVADAISGIVDSGPDAVLLDLNLGEGSGLTVLEALHETYPDVAFIVLTNHATEQYRRRSMASGARYFLDKSHDLHQVAKIFCDLRISRTVN